MKTGDIYDCVIVGGGPAGLGAGLYTARDGMKTLIVDKYVCGGQIINTDRIENYPGIEQIDGVGLIMNMRKQVENFNAEIKESMEVTGLKKLDDGDIEVICGDDVFRGKSVILSPGSSYRNLNVPGETEFRNAGAGVSYCGTCDAPFFKGKEVVCVGGGNTAVEETLHLCKFASKVTLVHRRDEFRATKILADELKVKAEEKDTNLVLKYDTVVEAIEGEGKVQRVMMRNVKNDEGAYEYPCDGVFIFIGTVPNTGFLDGFVDLTEHGYIMADCGYLRTKVPGVFAAGDCRIGAAMQLATAVSDGVTAAIMTKQHLRDPEWWTSAVHEEKGPGGW
jgi:thioredoxin reductase (NADPH)